MGRLNFSWVTPGEIAGHSAPMSADDLRYLKRIGILALVRMAECHKTQVSSAQIEELGFTDCHEPVPDFSAPRQAQIDRIISFMQESVAAKRPVGVSCGAGIGRTGTILACYLVTKGYSAQQSMEEVSHRRLAGIETGDQKEAVRTYENRLRTGGRELGQKMP